MTPPRHGGNLTWAARLAGCPPEELVDFSASINPLGPPLSAIAAIESHLSQLSAYPDPDYGDLRQALSQIHQVPADWILPGNGSAELLTWACRDLAQLASTDLFTPAFGDYGRALCAFGAQVVPHPLDLSQLATEGVVLGGLDRLVHPGPRGTSQGLLVNHPHNPTGQVFPLEHLRASLDQFQLVVLDAAFMDFLPLPAQAEVTAWVTAHPNLVILRSLTKFYSLPGLRIGYAIAHPQRLQRWQQWRDPWAVNVLAAAAGVAVVQDHDFQQQTWAWLSRARPQLFQGLAQLPGLQPFPGAANFLLVASDYPVLALQRQLLSQYQILIRDCVSFPELGDRYFRVAVRTEAENQQLLAALDQILTSAEPPH